MKVKKKVSGERQINETKVRFGVVFRRRREEVKKLTGKRRKKAKSLGKQKQDGREGEAIQKKEAE